MTKPRYVVVGTGSIGRRHIANLRRLVPHAHITAVKLSTAVDAHTAMPDHADRIVGTLAEAAAGLPHAAIIAGPATMHLAEAGALAEVGCHLMVEKPIADRLEGVDDLVALCKQRNLTLMVGYCLRFLPTLAALRNLVYSGAIGRVLSLHAEVGQYLPDWRPGMDYRRSVSSRAELGGGALLELSHEFDYVRWILGEPELVVASTSRLSDLEVDVEDSADILLTFPEKQGKPGPRATIHLDMFQRPACRQCKVIGSEGTAIMDCTAGSLRLYQVQTERWQDVVVPQFSARNDLYMTELRHFLQCIQTGAHPLVDGADARKTLAVALAAQASARTGRAVPFHL